MTDAWLFVSIGMAAAFTGSATVGDIISMADALMHGVPSKDDIEVTVSRLIAAGLVDTHAEELWLTEEGARQFQTVVDGRSPTDAMLELGRRWAAERFPPQASRTWSVPANVM